MEFFRNNKNAGKLSQSNNVYFKGVTFVLVLIKRRFDLHLLAEYGGRERLCV